MPPANESSIIEVPIVLEMPVSQPRHFDVVSAINYLLTNLLSHESGTLHADFQNGGGRWHVSGRNKDSSFAETTIATTDNKSIFRALLARFAHLYMEDQYYGGYSLRQVSQHGRKYLVAIYMANDQWTGYWLKAYSTLLSDGKNSAETGHSIWESFGKSGSNRTAEEIIAQVQEERDSWDD